MQRIRVGIVDDHAITRRALADYLNEQPSIEVAGEARSGREAIDLARTARLDVMLLDIDMPGQSGIDALAHILAREHAPAVLMLSTHPAAAYGVPMLRKGASGYLNKQCEPEEIVRAIRTVAGGKRYLGEDMTGLLLAEASGPPAKARHSTLTEREFQIFLRFAQGQSPEQVARELSLSPKTVYAYRLTVLAKMQARTNSELTYYAIKHGLMA